MVDEYKKTGDHYFEHMSKKPNEELLQKRMNHNPPTTYDKRKKVFLCEKQV